MLRHTQTDKWKDAWFLSLTPDEKLMFIFLTENCNQAGFFTIDFTLMQTLTGFDIPQIKQLLNKIKRCYVTNSSEDTPATKIWLTKYLFHQNKLPLELADDDSRQAYVIIKSNLAEFGHREDMLDIIEDLMTNKRKKKSNTATKFIIPAFPDFSAYYKSIGEVDEKQIANLYDYYVSCGWKVGAKPMKDWQASIRNAYRKKYNEVDNPSVKNTDQAFFPKIKNANECFTNGGVKKIINTLLYKLQLYISNDTSEINLNDTNNGFFLYLERIGVATVDDINKKKIYDDAIKTYADHDKKNNEHEIQIKNLSEEALIQHRLQRQENIKALARVYALQFVINKFKTDNTNIIELHEKKLEAFLDKHKTLRR